MLLMTRFIDAFFRKSVSTLNSSRQSTKGQLQCNFEVFLEPQAGTRHKMLFFNLGLSKALLSNSSLILVRNSTNKWIPKLPCEKAHDETTSDKPWVRNVFSFNFWRDLSILHPAFQLQLLTTIELVLKYVFVLCMPTIMLGFTSFSKIITRS